MDELGSLISNPNCLRLQIRLITDYCYDDQLLWTDGSAQSIRLAQALCDKCSRSPLCITLFKAMPITFDLTLTIVSVIITYLVLMEERA